MKKLLLGVTGSVAAVKVLDLAKSLQNFYEIRIVTTKQGEYFFASDLSALSALSIPVYRDQDEWPPLAGSYQVGDPICHIELRRWADLFLIAPLDANTLAKLAHGFCDNLVTSIVRAWDWKKPIVLCPAMNTMMWLNQPTEQHIKQLTTWGAKIVNPVEKKLACQDVGMGGMAAVCDIVQAVRET